MQDQSALAKEYVRRHFPEMTDVEPTGSQAAPGVTIFTFRKAFATPDGAQLSRVVRVTLGEDGQVLKVVSSR